MAERAAWHADLRAGEGAAAGLSPELRSVLAAATDDAASEAHELAVRHEEARAVADEERRRREEGVARAARQAQRVTELNSQGSNLRSFAVGAAFVSTFVNPFAITSFVAIRQARKILLRDAAIAEAGGRADNRKLAIGVIVWSAITAVSGIWITIMVIASFVSLAAA